jgi:IMP dehydrogenase
MKIKQALTFDDVLLVPKHSGIRNRSEVDLSVDLGKGVKLNIPIVSSNMKTVTDINMCAAMSLLGGLPIMHRFYSHFGQQLGAYNWAIESSKKSGVMDPVIGVSVGTLSNGSEELIHSFAKLNVKAICVDVAHGDSQVCIDTVEFISKNYPHMLLIAGNVATGSGAQNLVDAGADVIKAGVGSGSICLTRIEAGAGVPQLTALDEIYEQSDNGKKFKIISDGGLRKSGDCVKALCLSHVVMLGGMLAGTDEAPGETIVVDGKEFKTYSGSSTYKTSHVEGVTGLVANKGPVSKVIDNILQGIRSGCSYQGARNLEQLRKNYQFVSISNAGLIESKAHDVIVIK